MNDRNGNRLAQGDVIWFYPTKGSKRKGEVSGRKHAIVTGYDRQIAVKLDGDPFPVLVDEGQLVRITYDQETNKGGKVATKTAKKPSAKELRQQAKALGIEDYEEMDREELMAAIAAAEDTDEDVDIDDEMDEDEDEDEEEDEDEGEDEEDDEDEDVVGEIEDEEDEEDEEPARPASKKKGGKKVPKKTAKAKAKAKTSKKSAAKAKKRASSNGTPDNPFREGSNLYLITEALKVGGKRSKLVTKLHGQMSFRPRKNKGKKDYEEAIVGARIDLVCRLLKNEHGWDVEREGRGDNAKIKVTPA